MIGSEGMHGYGDAEQLDVQAAIDTIGRAAPGVPVMVAGWSFGADVALAVVDPTIAGWFLIAPPLRTIGLDDMAAAADPGRSCWLSRRTISSTHQRSPSQRLRHGQTRSVEVIEGTDHFLNGKVMAIARLAVAFARLLQTA
ncbi:MAG: hypothetical protein R2706_07905 [Acidimicrobiales bacterium]